MIGRVDKDFQLEELEPREMLDGSAELVREFNQPISSAVLANELYFVADNGERELWKSDGTTAGTVQVANLFGDESANPQVLAATDSHVFFQSRQNQLWSTDGSKAGTRFIESGFEASDSFDVLGQNFVFASWGDLLISDGTETGTVSLVSAPTGDDFSSITVLGDQFFFTETLYEEGKTQHWLWASDGTTEATSVISQLPDDVDLQSFTASGDNLYFVAGVQRDELWRANLAGDSHALLREGVPIPNLFEIGGNLSFFEDAGSVYGGRRSLWQTDGTNSGTSLIHDMGATYPDHFTIVGDELFYTVGDTLWRTDGSASGTRQQLAGINSTLAFPTAANGDFYFSMANEEMGKELWRIHGDQVIQLDLREGAAGSYPAVLGGIGEQTVLWVGAHEVWLDEDENPRGGLWVTDGVSTGTAVFEQADDDVLFPFSSNLGDGSVRPAFGLAEGFVLDVGGQVWWSDGTLGSSHPLGVVAQAYGDLFNREAKLFRVEKGVLLVAPDGSIWLTDGSRAGTQPILTGDGLGLISQASESFVIHDGKAYFLARVAGSDDLAIWTTDGTLQGTHTFPGVDPRVPPLIIQGISFDLRPVFLEFQGSMYFAASEHLWKLEGESASIAMPFRSVGPRTVTASAEHFFIGTWTAEQGYVLVATDGTDTGTIEVYRDDRINGLLTVRPGMHGVHFDAPRVAGREYGLWFSDGTVEGTRMISEEAIPPIPLSDSVSILLDSEEIWATDGTLANNVLLASSARGQIEMLGANNGQLFFWIERDLWVTDGTKEGTKNLGDVGRDHFDGPVEDYFTFANGNLYVSGGGHDNSTQLWRSDGTVAGTMQVTDIAVGKSGTVLKYMTEVDGHVYFRADDGFYGDELWRIATQEDVAETLPGDANSDDVVDFADFLILSKNFGRQDDVTFADGDFDADGRVAFSDFLLLSANFGTPTFESPVLHTVEHGNLQRT